MRWPNRLEREPRLGAAARWFRQGAVLVGTLAAGAFIGVHATAHAHPAPGFTAGIFIALGASVLVWVASRGYQWRGRNRQLAVLRTAAIDVSAEVEEAMAKVRAALAGQPWPRDYVFSCEAWSQYQAALRGDPELQGYEALTGAYAKLDYFNRNSQVIAQKKELDRLLESTLTIAQGELNEGLRSLMALAALRWPQR